MELIDKEHFEKLSPAAKRVAIAEDVLERLHTGKLHSGKQGLIKFPERYESQLGAPGDSAQEIVNENICSCCAKGALMVSWVGNFNEVSFGELEWFSYDLSNRSYPGALLDLFGREQLDLIEVYYEGRIIHSTDRSVVASVLGEEVAAKHYVFNGQATIFTRYLYDLGAIMRNIIDNHGTFVPPAPDEMASTT